MSVKYEKTVNVNFLLKTHKKVCSILLEFQTFSCFITNNTKNNYFEFLSK